MKQHKKITPNYWFKIEPYVSINIKNKRILLYNTLDGKTIESDKKEVIDLLKETLHEENCGVVFLTNERCKQKDINDFICELRDNYMGDIIDVTLSKGKPVQLLPYFNFPHKQEIYKKHNFSSPKSVLEKLLEISIYVDATTNIKKLIPCLQSISGKPTFNIIGDIFKVLNYSELLSFFNQHLSPKNLFCSYQSVIALEPNFTNNFSYQILVHFPIDLKQWNSARQTVLNQTLPVKYVFDVSTDEECLQAEEIINQFEVKNYRLNPVYTGDNLKFFEENVFLTKEDILSTPITMKDIFTRQAMNIYDFGKINIMPNGDVYANLNHIVLGNIYIDNIYEIVYKEMEVGKSWFSIRNQKPCNDCVYQWLCPSPSNYEILIGRPNLCHVRN